MDQNPTAHEKSLKITKLCVIKALMQHQYGLSTPKNYMEFTIIPIPTRST